MEQHGTLNTVLYKIFFKLLIYTQLAFIHTPKIFKKRSTLFHAVPPFHAFLVLFLKFQYIIN